MNCCDHPSLHSTTGYGQKSITQPLGHFTTCHKPKSSVQLSHSVMSSSLQPHGLQHSSFPVHHQLSELTQIHVHRVGDVIQPSHPLSSPVIPFSSFLQSFPASGSFPMSQFFTSGGQSQRRQLQNLLCILTHSQTYQILLNNSLISPALRLHLKPLGIKHKSG